MPDHTVPKLPVFATVRACYVLTWQHRRVFFAYAWPWLVGLVLLSALFYWLGFPDQAKSATADPPTEEPDVGWQAAVAGLVSFAIGVYLAVPWHRFLILSETPHVASTNPFRKRMGAYIGLSVVAMVPFLLALIPGILIGLLLPESSNNSALMQFANTIVYAACLVTMSRLWLLLPAVAVGRTADFNTIFAASRRNSPRFAFGFLLSLLPAAALSLALLFGFDPMSSQNRVVFTVGNVLNDLVSMIIGMTIVTYLSLAYKHFRDAAQSAAKQ